MSNDITPFEFNGKKVRWVLIDGKPWWVLKDLCDILGLVNPSDVATRVTNEYLAQAEVLDSRGIPRSTNVVSEPGMWQVILRSESPLAEPVQKWVYEEVLPMIRNTGKYAIKAITNNKLEFLAEQEARLRLIAAAKPSVLDQQWIDNLAREELQVGLRRELVAAKQDQSMSVEDYLRQRGINSEETRRKKSPTFGKKLKKLYTMERGESPMMATRFINGFNTEVCSYTEKDRPLFDEVYDLMFGQEEA